YERSMGEFGQLKGNIHWTIQLALHDGTLQALRPVISSMIEKWDVKNDTPSDILAGQLLYGISATVHSAGFENLSTDEKKACILDYIDRILE
ncbi:MAG: hypothetical protein K6E62_06480, partial [Lachnospiraceae bacterium]|nr:hypothetical protein [Lachnospiraceae bacterium]